MTVVNRLFEFLFSALAPLPHSVSLVVVAAIFGVILVPIYGKVSPQGMIAKAKKRIIAALYESVLFRRSSALSLKAQGKMGLNGLAYFCLAIPPILILSIPCLVVLAQCNLYFGLQGIVPGQPTLVVARLAQGGDIKGATLTSDQGIGVSAPVRDMQNREIAWRIIAPQLGEASINQTPVMKLQAGEHSLSLPLEIGSAKHKVYPLNSTDFWDNLFYPSGITLPAWLTSLEVRYPARDLSFGGYSADWVLVFLVVSILSGYGASKIFGVEV